MLLLLLMMMMMMMTVMLCTDEEPIADYNETSIRYRGRANPSKTFRLLQSATGSDSDSGEFK